MIYRLPRTIAKVRTRNESLISTKILNMNRRTIYFTLILVVHALPLGAQLQGLVLDAKNAEPLMGASVINRNTGAGAVTDLEGNFSLQASVGQVIAVSYTGYQAQEVAVTNPVQLSVYLEQGVLLDEIVVTGYSVDTRRRTPGSVSTVKARDLQIAPSGNVEQQLQGRASGVTVITNGQPGTSSQVRIRGYGALGGNRPLYVVDGVPVPDVDFLSPGDIESVTVLKDASAASIYGARAAGGVIVYTTKRGMEGRQKIKVTYDGLFGVTVPENGPAVLNPQEQAEWTWRAIRNAAAAAGETPKFNHPQYGTGPDPVLPDYLLVGPNNAGVSGTINLEDHRDRYNIDLDAGEIYQVVKANKEGTNWYDAITRNGLINRHHLGFSGGGNGSSYYIGMGMQEQEGILLNQKFSRYTFRANSNFAILPFLRVGENLQLTYSSRRVVLGSNGGIGLAGEGGLIRRAYGSSPIIPVYDEFGGYAGTAAPGLGFSNNPVAYLERIRDNRDFTAQTFGNVFAELEPVPALVLRTSFGGQFATRNTRNYIKKTYEDAQRNNIAAYNQFSSYAAQWIWTNTVNYQTTIGRHRLDFLASQEILDQGTGYDLNAAGVDPFSENIDFIGLSTTNSRTVEGARTNGVRFSSYFSRLNYDFADRYLLSVIVRRDGSSRFGSNNRFGTFPAVSAAWRLSSESFLSGQNLIEDLKIRAGYGVMGNSNNVDPNNQFSLFGTSLNASSYDIGGTNTGAVAGFYRTRIGNSSARWEKAVTTNIGIDALLFNGRLDIGLEFWRKETEDLLFRLPVTVQTGYFATEPFVNVGKMLNRGIDFVTALQGRSHAVTYQIVLNGSFLHNEIVALAPGIKDLPNRSADFGGIRPVLNQVGQPLSAFYGFAVQGIFQDLQEVESAPAQEGAGVGRFRFRDMNEDGIINLEDRTNIGNPIADFTGGLAWKIGYRNLELEVYSYVSIGNEIYNINRNITDFYPTNPNGAMGVNVKNSWTPENPDSDIPIYENVSNFSTNTQSVSYYVEDGSYFRLQNITLSYLLPAQIQYRWNLEYARLFISVNNAFTITRYSGLDPSVGGAMDTNFGIDLSNFPITRNWVVGVNLSF